MTPIPSPGPWIEGRSEKNHHYLRGLLEAVSLVGPRFPLQKKCGGNFREDVAPREDFDDNELNFRDRSRKIGGVGEKWEKRKKERIYRALS